MDRWRKSLIGFGLLALLAGLALILSGRQEPQVGARLVALAGEAGDAQAAGFRRVTGPAPLAFPAAHGPHLDYQTEWWYYTGNLVAEGGQRFGYQLTFFRRALIAPAEVPTRTSKGQAWPGGSQSAMARSTPTW